MKQAAVYMTGNGKIAARLQSGDYKQVFGPPYSSAVLFGSTDISSLLRLQK